MMKRTTWLYFILACILLTAAHFYYPKWKQTRTESTISWDVSGYYMYLPATFIYKDLKKCGFQDEIVEKYHPTFDFQQAFIHEKSGNYVMKYPIGQAIQFLPFFGIAHAYATISDQYPADGFSFPYQFMIGISGLLIAFLGMYFSLKILNEYFEPHISGLAVLGIVLGSNYLEYAGITGSMTHNHLYTINAIIIWLTINYYKSPSWKRALGVGLMVGLSALTRPTEIVIAIIPMLWLVSLSMSSIKERIGFIKDHWKHFAIAIFAMFMVGSIQLIYWKYVSGDWLVYSYEDQGFSWLHPHIWQGLFSTKAGWLMYSPFMIFAVVGFYFLRQYRKDLYPSILLYFLVFAYITWAWDIWWYGGSMGQRAMVQNYPALLFPLAAFFRKFPSFNNIVKIVLGVIFAGCIYINLWWTHQAHRGGMLRAGEMTTPYYWKILGTWDYNRENEKLLDTKYLYEGDVIDKKDITPDLPSEIILSKDNNALIIPVETALQGYDWLRVEAEYKLDNKDWNMWTMAQVYTKFVKNGVHNQESFIRISRLLDNFETRIIHFDAPIPTEGADSIKIEFYIPGTLETLTIKNLTISLFKEA